MIGRSFVKSFTFLNSKIISPIKHLFFPKKFRFITLPPQQNLEFKSFPHEEWQSKKYEEREINKLKYFSLFLVSFFVGDWLYSFKNNQNLMYYYFVNYPLAMKAMETTIYNVQRIVDPFVQIMPKQKYEIPQVWGRLKNAILDSQNKQKTKDQNVQKLKAELKQFDSKLK